VKPWEVYQQTAIPNTPAPPRTPWEIYAAAKPADSDAGTWSQAGNIVRGAGEAAMDVAGWLLESGGAIAEDLGDEMERRFPLGTLSKPGVPMTEQEIAAPNLGRTLQEIGRTTADVDFGYEEKYSWDRLKNSEGILDAAGNLIGFATEQGLVSVPHMIAAITNPAAYTMALAGGIGTTRAENQGRPDDVHARDVAEAAPAALASALMERFGARGVLGLDDTVRRVADIPGAMAKAGVKEGVTEFGQEQLEYAGETVGTKTPWEFWQSLERGAAGALAGGPFGAGVRAGTAAVQLAVNPDADSPGIGEQPGDNGTGSPPIPGRKPEPGGRVTVVLPGEDAPVSGVVESIDRRGATVRLDDTGDLEVVAPEALTQTDAGTPEAQPAPSPAGLSPETELDQVLNSDRPVTEIIAEADGRPVGRQRVTLPTGDTTDATVTPLDDGLVRIETADGDVLVVPDTGSGITFAAPEAMPAAEPNAAPKSHADPDGPVTIPDDLQPEIDRLIGEGLDPLDARDEAMERAALRDDTPLPWEEAFPATPRQDAQIADAPEPQRAEAMRRIGLQDSAAEVDVTLADGTDIRAEIGRAGLDDQGRPWLELRQDDGTVSVVNPGVNAEVWPAVSAAESRRYVATPDNAPDWGAIDANAAQAIGRQAAPIRLRVGDKTFGLAHIRARHGEDAKRLGYQDVEHMVLDITRNWTAVYQGKGRSLILAKETPAHGHAYVQLEPSPDGDFYDVKTATPSRTDQFRSKKPLWERAGPSASPAVTDTVHPSVQSKPIVAGLASLSYTPAVTDRARVLQRALKSRLREMGLGDVNVVIADDIGGGTRDGFYWKKLIAVALDRGETEAFHTLNHEAIHAARRLNVLRGREWAALDRAATSEGWMDRFRVRERYPDLSPEQQTEEAIADAYRAWVAGKGPEPRNAFARRALHLLRRVFEHIRATFQGQTLTADDVFRRVRAGALREQPSAPPRSSAGRPAEGRRPVGPFGPVFTAYRHDARGAISRLIREQDGEAVAALHHPEIGDIDLVWGVVGTGASDGYGLAKLVRFHPEVLDDLQGALSAMQIVQRGPNRIRLASPTHKAVVRLDWDGRSKTWLLTAFEKNGSGVDTTTDTAKLAGGDDTARSTTTPATSIAEHSPEFHHPETEPPAESRRAADQALRDGLDGLAEQERQQHGDRNTPEPATLARQLGRVRSVILHPRMIASRHPTFVPVYQAVIARRQLREKILSELTEKRRPYAAMTPKEKARVNAVLEIGRLHQTDYSDTQLREGVTTALRHLSAAKRGTVYKLTDPEIRGYRAYRGTMNHALGLFRDQMIAEYAERLGVNPEDVRDLNHIAEHMRMVDPDSRAMDEWRRFYDTILQIENQTRVGYVPFTRWGRIGITIRSKTETEPVPGSTTETRPKVVHFEKIDIDGLNERVKRLMVRFQRNGNPDALRNIPAVRKALADLRRRYPAAQYDIAAPIELVPKQNAEDITLTGMDALANASGLMDSDSYDEVRDAFEKALQARGFRRHFFNARHIAGYSGDLDRAGADYVTGISRHLSDRAWKQPLDTALGHVDPRSPRLVAYARKYLDYIDQPQEEFQTLRAMAFYWLLSGVGSAAVNLLQVPGISVFYAAMFQKNPVQISYMFARAYAETLGMVSLKAGWEVIDPNKAPRDMREDFKRAFDEGEMWPITTMEEMAQAHRRDIFAGIARRVGSVRIPGTNTQVDIGTIFKILGHLFTLAERVNRAATFIVGHRLGQQAKTWEVAERIYDARSPLAQEALKDRSPSAFAAWLIEETHYRMGKENRPTVATGPGALILQFRGYTMQTLELYARLATRHGPEGRMALAGMMGWLLLTAGVLGLPFFDDLKDIIEGVWKQAAGVDRDFETEFRRFADAVTGVDSLGEIITRGFLRKSPTDVSRRIGMGDIFPTEMHDLGWADLAGPAISTIVQRVSKMAVAGTRPNMDEALAIAIPAALPAAFAYPIEGLVSYPKVGVVSSHDGMTLIPPEDITNGDKIMKALGFTSARLASEWERRQAIRRQESAVDLLRSRTYMKLALALVDYDRADKEKNEEGVRRAADRVQRVADAIEIHNKAADAAGRPWEEVHLQLPTLKRKVAELLQGRAPSLPRRLGGAQAETNALFGGTRAD